MYRPPGFKNPHPFMDVKLGTPMIDSRAKTRFGDWEAGADAMLEGLRKEGITRIIQSGKQPWYNMPRQSVPNKDGWLVFIPDND